MSFFSPDVSSSMVCSMRLVMAARLAGRCGAASARPSRPVASPLSCAYSSTPVSSLRSWLLSVGCRVGVAGDVGGEPPLQLLDHCRREVQPLVVAYLVRSRRDGGERHLGVAVLVMVLEQAVGNADAA